MAREGFWRAVAQSEGGPGAPFPRKFADFSYEKNSRRMFIEQSDQSRKFAPQLRDCAIGAFPSAIFARHIFGHRRYRSQMPLIIGLVFRRSLYVVEPRVACCGRERAA